MKKIEIISVSLIIAFVSTLQAQFTQIELFSGFEKTDFTLFSNYSINDSNTLSIATLVFFQKFREKENRIFDEVGVQPTLFWNINKTIALGPSLYYNSFGGFSERLSGKRKRNDPRKGSHRRTALRRKELDREDQGKYSHRQQGSG